MNYHLGQTKQERMEKLRIRHRLVAVSVLMSSMTAVLVAQQYRATTSWELGQALPQDDRQVSTPRGPEPKGSVPKYGIVWPGKLTRSGLPKKDDGWKWLRAQGTKTIVNFRERNDVDYKKYGFVGFLWIPLVKGQMPTEKEADKYLNWIQDPANQPVNIECAEGRDRTGMMAALARYAVDGWSMEEAINEASLYRKGKPLSADRIEWLRRWAATRPPGSYRRK